MFLRLRYLLQSFSISTIFSFCHSETTTFLEKDGVLVMEAESTDSRLGDWEKKTDVKDYTGSCHLEFTGNSIMNGPPKSPLEYKFKITKSGVYALILRARKRLETERHDLSNDCYVRVEGDYESGGDVPRELLEEDTKLFGGSGDRWGWAVMLDKNHKKHKPRYSFKEGESYTLTLSGRSKNFNFDRIFFIHEDEKINRIKESLPKESATEQEIKNKKPTVRILTNTKGVKVTATILDADEDSVQVLIKGKKFDLPRKSLSKEDQAFFSEWQP